MFGAIVILVGLFILWKLFIDGLLFKIILFCFGWVGLFVCLNVYVAGAKNTALTLGSGTHISWSVLIPTIVCLLALAFTKGDK